VSPEGYAGPPPVNTPTNMLRSHRDIRELPEIDGLDHSRRLPALGRDPLRE